MERFAAVGIVAILVISIFAVLYVNSATGAYSSSYGYGSKVYGGGLKKAMSGRSGALGKQVQYDTFLEDQRAYLYENKDKWDCSFGKEAETSAYPCFFDESLQKYCCVIQN